VKNAALGRAISACRGNWIDIKLAIQATRRF